MTIKYQVRSSSLLIYDNRVCGLAKQLKPSARGELEITDLNKLYLAMGVFCIRDFDIKYRKFDIFSTVYQEF